MSSVEDTIDMLESWSQAYPVDIFPEVTKEDIEYINAVNPNLSARFFASNGRHFIKKGFEPAIAALRSKQVTLTKDEIIEIRMATKAKSTEPWADTIAFAEALLERAQA